MRETGLPRSFEEAVFLKRHKVKKELFDYLNNLQTAWKIDDWKKRLHFLGRYLIPTRENLISRYEIKRTSALPFFYLIHPFVLARRALESGIYILRQRRKTEVPGV